MRLQVEVWRENEERLRRQAHRAGNQYVRDTASLLLNLKIQEEDQKLARAEQAVEEVA